MIEKEQFSLSANHGFGKDVASDREDDLDRACLAHVSNIVANKAGASPTLVLDIGGANGAMSAKMANRGATVTLIDPIPNPIHIVNNTSLKMRHAAKRIQDITKQDLLGSEENKVDIIYGQKVFHYMPYSEALETLKKLREQYASKQCKLFVSFSSLDCALGKSGYAGRDHPITKRHAVPLNDEAAHLGISHPMTLYRKEEVKQLLEQAGFKNIEITESAYGTFKAIAENELAVERNPSKRII